jgi:YD repeat-containing protein
MDRLVKIDQGDQLRKFKYDALGRLLFERIPEQDATIDDGTSTMWSCKYSWNDLNQLATKTDARGVVITYGYDDLNRMTSISHNTSGASGVATTPNVTYTFDTSQTSATLGLPVCR